MNESDERYLTAEEFASPAEDVADILTQIFISGILPYLNRASR